MLFMKRLAWEGCLRWPTLLLDFGMSSDKWSIIQLKLKEQEGPLGLKMFSIHSKRNRTISLGERGQLDFMVSRSVIRWASCTHLPTDKTVCDYLYISINAQLSLLEITIKYLNFIFMFTRS